MVDVNGAPRSATLAEYPKSRSKTGLVYDLRMMLHAPINYTRDGDTDGFDNDLEEYRSSHPEEPRRISEIFSQLKSANLVQGMVHLPCPQVTPSQALLVHTDDVWQELEKTQCT
jgi:hypothetical protein